MSYPTLGALLRFGRTLAAVALGAVVAYAVGHIQEVVPDPAVAAVAAAILAALDKFLREKGWLSYPVP